MDMCFSSTSCAIFLVALLLEATVVGDFLHNFSMVGEARLRAGI